LAVVQNELRANLRVTGENAFKAGLRGAGNAAESAGDDLRRMGKDAEFLQRKLIELKATQIALVRELNATGDVSLIKDINKSRREVRQYERLSADLAKAGADAAKGFMSGFAEIKSMGPVAIGGLVAAIGAILPGLGAMVAGAVTGLVGAGGLVGGVVAAMHDPAVKAAGKDMATSLGSTFKEVGTPFAGPIVASLELVKDAGREIAVDLKHDFDILAPALVPFTKGLLGLVTEIMPGLTAAFQSSLPVLRAMSTELPKIGHAVGEFFRILSEDRGTAVLGFIALSKVIQNALIYTAKFVQALGNVYKGMVVNGELVTSVLQKTTGWLTATGLAGQFWVKNLGEQHDMYQGLLDDMNKATGASDDFTAGLFGMGNAADRTAADIADMNTAIDDLFNKTMNVEQANVAWADGLGRLKKELADGQKTLSLNTQAGIDNRKALDDQLEIAERFREAQVAMFVPLDQANQKYLEQVESLRQLALKMGFTRAEVDAFIKKWLEIPNAKQIQLNLQAGGDAAAWAAFRALERHDVGAAPKPLSPGVTEFRAGGGPVTAGRGYIVGENGPEPFFPSQNGYVASNSQMQAMMSGASGGSRPQVSISFQPSGNSAMDAIIQAIWPYLINQVRVDGGDLSAFGAA